MHSSSSCDPPRHLSWNQGLEQKAQTAARLAVVWIAIGLLAAAVMRADGALGRQLEVSAKPSELIYLPPTPFLKAVCLGYQHALADVLWFRTISYFGRHYRDDRLYPWLAGMCNAVTDLDPAAEYVYRFGGLILLWEADFTDAGIALLEKGTQNIPASWELQYMLGFSYYFFKDDLAAASRTLHAAALLPDAPEFVSGLAALTHAAREGASRAIDFLTEVERNSTSDEIRKVIRQRIRELTLSRDIEALQAATEAFAKRFSRQPMALEELVSTGMLASIPPEPFGGRYLYDPQTRRVQSSLGHQPRHLSSSRKREELLKRLGQEGDHGSRT